MGHCRHASESERNLLTTSGTVSTMLVKKVMGMDRLVVDYVILNNEN